MASPAGAMEYHYVHPGLAQDAEIDVFAPEVILYMPTEDGVVLVGVEWLLGVGPPGTPVPDDVPDAPVVLRQEMGGPMEGHDPEMPPHYDLHMWFQNNPDGMYASFNPAFSCPE